MKEKGMFVKRFELLVTKWMTRVLKSASLVIFIFQGRDNEKI